MKRDVVMSSIKENSKEARLSDLSLALSKEEMATATNGHKLAEPYNDTQWSGTTGYHGFDNTVP